MTMITVMQVGALTFMTLLPVALSVILYMPERQPWTKNHIRGNHRLPPTNRRHSSCSC